MTEPRIATSLPMVVDRDTATIRNCVEAIQVGGANVALVVDPSGVLEGIVTDGDVRRAWLAGSQLSDGIDTLVQRAPLTVGPGRSRSTILELMQSRGISQVPVVDDGGRLRGLHTLRALLGRESRANAAVVLAGGRGTRLHPITLEVPKPMLPVAGRPILERIVTHLVGYGVEKIFLAVGFRADVIEQHFGDGHSFGCTINYLQEDPDSPLGTAGPLSGLRPNEDLNNEPVLVLNGDLVTQFDVAQLLERHSSSRAQMTVGVSSHAHEVPFGVVHTNDQGNIIDIVEKPLRVETVSAGIYALQPDIVTRVPIGGFTPMTDVLNDCLARGEVVAAWDCGPDWIDIGQPHDLARARGES